MSEAASLSSSSTASASEEANHDVGKTAQKGEERRGGRARGGRGGRGRGRGKSNVRKRTPNRMHRDGDSGSDAGGSRSASGKLARRGGGYASKDANGSPNRSSNSGGRGKEARDRGRRRAQTNGTRNEKGKKRDRSSTEASPSDNSVSSLSSLRGTANTNSRYNNNNNNNNNNSKGKGGQATKDRNNASQAKPCKDPEESLPVDVTPFLKDISCIGEGRTLEDIPAAEIRNCLPELTLTTPHPVLRSVRMACLRTLLSGESLQRLSHPQLHDICMYLCKNKEVRLATSIIKEYNETRPVPKSKRNSRPFPTTLKEEEESPEINAKSVMEENSAYFFPHPLVEHFLRVAEQRKRVSIGKSFSAMKIAVALITRFALQNVYVGIVIAYVKFTVFGGHYKDSFVLIGLLKLHKNKQFIRDTHPAFVEHMIAEGRYDVAGSYGKLCESEDIRGYVIGRIVDRAQTMDDMQHIPAYHGDRLCNSPVLHRRNFLERYASVLAAQYKMESHFPSLLHGKPLQFHFPPSSLLWVDNEESMKLAEDMLLSASPEICIGDEEYAALLGFDTETKPAYVSGVRHPVALLQLATRRDTVVFDLHRIVRVPRAVEAFQVLMMEVLQSRRFVKLGVAIKDDFKGLARSRPKLAECFRNPPLVLELAKLYKALVPMSPPQMSLSNLTVYSFGYFLSKKLRMTDWERRPLTQAELQYAAMDAVVAIGIFDVLYKDAKVLHEQQHKQKDKQQKMTTAFSVTNFCDD